MMYRTSNFILQYKMEKMMKKVAVMILVCCGLTHSAEGKNTKL